ncbi:hypothetical protein QCI44_12870 [Bacillus cereus group sp. RP37]|uniref:Imm50 family immunity protein n=1 Tax=Bacillus cereus group sp. RP37 TaxID=3040259 RepID=UPI003398D53D
MWYINLEGSRFISNLYNEAPSLSDVRIVAVKIEDEGKKISVNFNIPKFADNPPKNGNI